METIAEVISEAPDLPAGYRASQDVLDFEESA